MNFDLNLDTKITSLKQNKPTISKILNQKYIQTIPISL